MIVAELDKRRRLVERFHDGAGLAADEPMFRQIAQQRDRAERAEVYASWGCSGHHRTQQVINRGFNSPVRTIQIVLTTARRSCREIATSTCQRAPQASLESSVASSRSAALRNLARRSAASARPMPRASRKMRALWRPRGCSGSSSSPQACLDRDGWSPFGRLLIMPEEFRPETDTHLGNGKSLATDGLSISLG